VYLAVAAPVAAAVAIPAFFETRYPTAAAVRLRAAHGAGRKAVQKRSFWSAIGPRGQRIPAGLLDYSTSGVEVFIHNRRRAAGTGFAALVASKARAASTEPPAAARAGFSALRCILVGNASSASRRAPRAVLGGGTAPAGAQSTRDE